MIGLFIKADVIAAVVRAALGHVMIAPAGGQRDGKIPALTVVIRRAERDVLRLGLCICRLLAAAGSQRQRQCQYEHRNASFHADCSFPCLV